MGLQEDQKALSCRKVSLLTSKEYDPTFKKDNLKRLRLYLEMTQKAFIDYFLTDESGRPGMSVASLSNLEARGGPQLNKVLVTVGEKLNFDPLLFSLSREEFEKSMVMFVDGTDLQKTVKENSVRKDGLADLLNRLTLYFADEIFEGNLKRGDQIKPERELAKELEVGRSSIREALKILSVLGMIDIRPGQGTFISGKDTSFFVIPLSWSLFLQGDQIDNILGVRDLLEAHSAELAANNLTEEGRAELTGVFEGMQKAYAEGNIKDFLDGDIKFHTTIAKLSGNPIIFSEIQTIRNLLRSVSQTVMASQKEVDEIFFEHQTVYDAVISGDVQKAHNAMHSHTQSSHGRYVKGE